jgi:hypothetical protein
MTNLGSVEPQGVFLVTKSFTDVAGDAVTPTAITYDLSDEYGNIINSKEDVVVTPLATSATIILSGADFNPEESRTRIITVTAIYDSVTYGNGLISSTQNSITLSAWVGAEPTV